MTAESEIELFKTLQDHLIATNDPRDAEHARVIEVMLQARGEGLIYDPQTAAEIVSAVAEQSTSAPDLFSKVYPEISLPEEQQRQALILAGRFAARLGMSQEAYIATLPQFPEKPSNYSALGLNIPGIFETRVPWMEAAELSGIYITDYLRERANAGEVSDWEDDKFETPQVPFSAWVQDGTKFVYRKPSDVRKELGKRENRDYRAGRILDSITIWNVRPDMVKTMYWDIIGNKVGSGLVPFLDHWDDGGPKLFANLVGSAGPSYRAFVLGREIRTLDLAA